MAWKCKQCGGEIVNITTRLNSTLSEIKKDGGIGKRYAHKKHDFVYEEKLKCLECGEYTLGTGTQALKRVAEWIDE